ncbi:MAG: hypothetical protein HZB46_18810 [Solirubrobacterales bacterium]|nr:hypothetical protein [Solirubrobacterales bacterium]
MTAPRLLLPLAVAGLLATAAPASAKLTITPFQTPTKQIRCAYMSGDGFGPLIRCDLLFLNDRAVVLDKTGKARRATVTDTVADPKGKVLGYGKSRRFGRFTCTSRRTGLTCRNRANGHGFTVSRERQKVW